MSGELAAGERPSRSDGGRLLYIDAIGGIAGDMLLGALLDAGAPLEDVRAGLRGLGIDGLDLAVERTQRHQIGAARVRVVAPHRHAHRDWAAVCAVIDRAGLPPRAHARAHETFRRLALAEARVHGVAPERVHFHEVGALDALADVCGVALALERLDVGAVACSPLPIGRGLIGAAHGVLPLPAPAALELLRHTSTLGVRIAPVARWELAREHRTVSIAGERIAVKIGRLAGEVVNVAPEHDDVARAAAALGQPAKAIWARALAAAANELGNPAAAV